MSTEIEYTNKNGEKVKTTALDGKIDEIFKYQDRYENSEALQKAINKPNTVIHFYWYTQLENLMLIKILY